MDKILNDFEAYLYLYKKFSINTYLAYKKDVQDFLSFLSDNNFSLQDLCSDHFVKFFNSLKHKNLSSSCVSRKVSALKVFTLYLHQKLGMQDFSEDLDIDFNFVLFCNAQKIFQISQSFKNKNLTNLELRNYLIFYLLYITKINVNQLVNIKLRDICNDSKTILINEKKKIFLPVDGYELLKKYIAAIPFNSTYLFEVKFGNTIKPISRQAVWNIIRSLFSTLDLNTLNYGLTGTNKIDAEPEIVKIYKNIHPRA